MLTFLTAGESHGPQLTAILEGMVAGLPLAEDIIANEMSRRQKGFGSGGRMSIEKDRARITGGVMARLTTGGPIALTIDNRDWGNWREKDIAPFTVPRPGHADLTGAIKYRHRDLRLSLERASARETAARVAIGAICKQFLSQFSIVVGSYVTMIGGISWSGEQTVTADDYLNRFKTAEASTVRCPHEKTSELMHARIKEAIKARDTLGGIFEVVALGLPPGLGSYSQADQRLDARLLGAVGSVPGVKGAEVGLAFENAGRFGTQVHDPIALDSDGNLMRATNNAAGLEGGITNGQPVIVRGAMKPISTTLTPIGSVDLATGAETDTVYERSDICSVPRAAVVGEAAVAYVLADTLLAKLGGDSMEEIIPRYEALAKARLADLPMDDKPWRFGYAE